MQIVLYWANANEFDFHSDMIFIISIFDQFMRSDKCSALYADKEVLFSYDFSRIRDRLLYAELGKYMLYNVSLKICFCACHVFKVCSQPQFFRIPESGIYEKWQQHVSRRPSIISYQITLYFYLLSLFSDTIYRNSRIPNIRNRTTHVTIASHATLRCKSDPRLVLSFCQEFES